MVDIGNYIDPLSFGVESPKTFIPSTGEVVSKVDGRGYQRIVPVGDYVLEQMRP